MNFLIEHRVIVVEAMITLTVLGAIVTFFTKFLRF